jgi:hypothetical protein
MIADVRVDYWRTSVLRNDVRTSYRVRDYSEGPIQRQLTQVSRQGYRHTFGDRQSAIIDSPILNKTPHSGDLDISTMLMTLLRPRHVVLHAILVLHQPSSCH